MKPTSDARQRELCRRIAEYADVYPDSNFLDEMHAWGNGSGIRFTIAQAEAIEDALAGWKRRVSSARYDPDRCPPGYDEHIWVLAGEFRAAAEAEGLPCPGPRIVYQELHRAVRRDKLDQDYTPWRDENGRPGWVRMLSKVIQLFIYENAATQYPYGLHQDLAQPGVISSLNNSMVEQAMLDLIIQRQKENKLSVASTRQPTPARQAAVRAYIVSRENHADLKTLGGRATCT